MNAIKSKYAYVLKSIKKDVTLRPKFDKLDNLTYIISGGTRGIGFNIGKKLASLGANVTLLGKTETAHPKLEHTIYSAAEEINDVTKSTRCVGIPCDIRNNEEIDHAINETRSLFGNIDGVVLNASALCLNNTLDQSQKEIDLMTSVNIKGTFIMGQKCLKYIKKSDHGNVLIIAPPINMLDEDEWWINHLYYSMSKFNMSLMAKFWNKEFPNVGINTLWPRTTISTAPVRNILGGEDMINISRKPDIMGDAASIILKSDPLLCTGKNFIDDEVIASVNRDVEKYRVKQEINEKDLMPDFFC